MIVIGNYVNVYDDWYDVFIILNEPNYEPRPDEIEDISNVVSFCCSEIYSSRFELSHAISEMLDEKQIDCLSFGYQVVVKRYKVEV